MSSRKFWQRGSVSKMLEKPGKAFQKTFRLVTGRKLEFEDLARVLSAHLPRLERGIEVLDRDFPIREGESRIDYLLVNPAKEITFVWLQRRCSAEIFSKLLLDYHWIQKNCALWPHLFPQVLDSRGLQMRVWIFALEIDADLPCFLHYLQGVRIQIFHAQGEGETWRFPLWKTSQEIHPSPPLPSSPTLLNLAGKPKLQTPVRVASPLLTQEELNDLLGGVASGAGEGQDGEETTDPHYELPPG